MRLTLRTLLAYLDDVLDPADKEALGKKIESSEFAEDLVHRTKDTMRRLRLSAPQVIGTGMGLDPNSVAEYLDNVMPPESVGDFERICLESDMHLAEVASCHHVLTMVLGQPADIDPAAKQRMYTIPTELADKKQHRVETSHVAAAGQPIVPPIPVGSLLAAQSPAVPARHAEVPEYLRAGGWTRVRNMLLGLAALLMVAATVYIVGDMRGWFSGKSNSLALAPEQGIVDVNVPAPNTFVATAPPEATTAATPAPAETVGAAPTERYPETPTTAPGGPVMTAPTSPDAAMSNASPPAEAPRYPAAPAVDVGAAQVSVGSDRAGSVGSPTTDAVAAAPPEMAPAAAMPQENVTTNVVPEGGAPMPGSAVPVGTHDPTSVTVDPDGTVRVGDVAPAGVDAAAAAATAPAVEPEPPAIVELGTYRGGKTVLLRHDDTTGAWLRVAPRTAVVKGERLLALPEFRPNVTLANGVHMDLSGGTMVGLDAVAGGTEVPATEAVSPSVEIVYGRVVLINTSNEDRTVRLVLGPTTGEAKLAQNATLAIDVERKYVPGNDPRKAPAPLVARLFVPDGGVTWQDANGATTVDKVSEWTISDGVPTAVVASTSPPTWIDQEAAAQSSEQRYAAPVIDTSLVSNRPVDVQLLELFQGNARREVKSLVARSGMHVGLYVPFIEALRDSAQRPNWNAQIEALRSAMALSPESAEKIWQALVEQRGPAAAADLYEMLCGYNAEQIGHTPDQMKAGAVARLIDWLDKDSLDYRVLAVHDLWEITGKQLMPNPAGSISERAQQIKRWRSRLDSGQLMPAASEEDAPTKAGR